MLLAKTFRSRTFRLALMAIAAFGAIVLSLLGFVYWSATSYVSAQTDRAIMGERDFLMSAYDRGARAALIGEIKKNIAERALNGGVYLLADPEFKPLAGNLDRWPAELKTRPGWMNLPIANRSYRVAASELPDGAYLLLGRNREDITSFTRNMSAALAATLVLIALLAAVVSVLVTRRTVGRIESINATSRAIMERGLAARIRLRGINDEWDDLARNLNSMLDRIEVLMTEVREVTDNVAHDLRTPLARIRGRLEKMSNAPRSPAADQELIENMIVDLDDVLRIFSSLMRISQIESAARTEAFAATDLTTIAQDVVELFDAAAEEKNVRLSVEAGSSVFVTGDRDLIFDAVANLVDNAIKHGRQDGKVVVVVESFTTEATISVSDDGVGIPPAEFSHVLKRFYRLEPSRCTAGNGLGLSLVAAVAQLHKARVDMQDNRPGLRFRLVFLC